MHKEIVVRRTVNCCPFFVEKIRMEIVGDMGRLCG